MNGVEDPVEAALRACSRESPEVLDQLGARARRWSPDLLAGLSAIYPEPQLPALLERLAAAMCAAYRGRSAGLRSRDLDRLLEPRWYQRPDAIGYAAYTERFAGTLRGVVDKIDYLRELGVTYLHLLPLLAPRPGDSDGGYAVADYRSVRADLGTMSDLAALADQLHENGISLTIDLVLNHVAAEHAWARAARAGSPYYRDFFLTYPDRTLPDAYEATLPEVFPDFAPGNFSWDDALQRWVWTTFNSFQWDLNWANPDVFVAFTEIVLFLANHGVDCLRLDAIAFVWKRMGTNCQNQPEVHAITEALRAIVKIMAPATVFKAEAIVSRRDLTAYLGSGPEYGRVSELAYHNVLMVQIWSALATADARLLVTAMDGLPAKPLNTAWITYLRGHDDIGWAIDDDDALRMGWSGPGHRRFLADYYAGPDLAGLAAPGSQSAGAYFQVNPDTGDARTSGTTASLLGLERALANDNPSALDLALARIFCAHAMIYGFGGIPVLWSGDELGQRNDYDYARIAEHAADSRWLHRPALDLVAAGQRHDPTSVPGRIFAGLAHLAARRAGLSGLHGEVETVMQSGGSPALLFAVRHHPAQTIVGVYNVSDRWQRIPEAGLVTLRSTLGADAAEDVISDVRREFLASAQIAPYGAWWLSR